MMDEIIECPDNDDTQNVSLYSIVFRNYIFIIYIRNLREGKFKRN